MQFVCERVWIVSKSDGIDEGEIAPTTDNREARETFETALLSAGVGCSRIPSMLVIGPVWWERYSRWSSRYDELRTSEPLAKLGR